MNRKKNNTVGIILFALLLCILYTIFAVKPLSTELHMSPQWTSPISNAIPEAKNPDETISENNISSEKLIPYKLKQNIGYFTSSGKISSAITFPYKSTISSDYYTFYTTNCNSFTIYDNKSNEVCTIKASGYPFIQEDRIYLMLPGGTSFAKYDIEGNKIFQYESYAPITAFSSSKNGTVAGFADGHIVAFNNEGKIVQNFIPGGSENNIILGADISEDGLTIACITGQNRQRFIISRQEGERSKIIFHDYLEKELQHQTLVKFHGDCVFYGYNGGIGSVHLEKLKNAHIPIKGSITQIEFIDDLNLGFILSKEKNSYTVSVLESFDNVNSSFSYNAASSFIQTENSNLFIGKDDRISCIKISRR